MQDLKQLALDRYEVCKECPRKTTLLKIEKCKECGCILYLKLLVKDEKCPLGKW